MSFSKHEELTWHATDPDIGQFGRCLCEGVFEFYTEGGYSSLPEEIYNFAEPDDAIEINISNFTDEQIRSIISAYGYCIDPDKEPVEKGFVEMNMAHWDRESREWIIAECIYEQNYE